MNDSNTSLAENADFRCHPKQLSQTWILTRTSIPDVVYAHWSSPAVLHLCEVSLCRCESVFCFETLPLFFKS